MNQEHHQQHHVSHLKEMKVRSANADEMCRLLREIGLMPKSVVDVGCGYGFFLSAVKREWPDATLYGLDGPWVETDSLLIAKEEFREVNLEEPVVLDRTFDLAACLEVAEHLAEEHAGRLVDLLTAASEVVLFSAAIPGQGGQGHVNEKYPSYWCRLFQDREFVVTDVLHSLIWANDQLLPWFRQNLFIFCSKKVVGKRSDWAPHVKEFQLLDRVHPAYFQSKCKRLNQARMKLRDVTR